MVPKLLWLTLLAMACTVTLGGQHSSKPKGRHHSAYSFDSHRVHAGKKHHHSEERYHCSGSSESDQRHPGKHSFHWYYRYPGKQNHHSNGPHHNSKSPESHDRYPGKGYQKPHQSIAPKSIAPKSIVQKKLPQCVCSTYTQEVEVVKIQQWQVSVDQLAVYTQDQMYAGVKRNLGVTLVESNYTYTKTEKSVTIRYNAIYNCDGPVKVVALTGKNTTVETTWKTEQKRIQETIQSGISDCVNHYALEAHGRGLGIKDISCNYRFGCDNAFVWEIETTKTIVQQSVSVAKFKTAALFYGALEKYFSQKIVSTYKEVTTVKFLGIENYANGRCGLKFQAQCSKSFVDIAYRTKFLSFVQQAYYGCLSSYFGSACKGVKFPRTCQVATPPAVKAVTTTITLVRSFQVSTGLVPGNPVVPANNGQPQKAGGPSGAVAVANATAEADAQDGGSALTIVKTTSRTIAADGSVAVAVATARAEANAENGGEAQSVSTSTAEANAENGGNALAVSKSDADASAENSGEAKSVSKSDADASAESSGSAEATSNAKSQASAESSGSAEATSNAKSQASAESSGSAEATSNAQSQASAESSGSAEATSNAKSQASAESSGSAEATSNAKSQASAESSESAEATSNAQSEASAESSGSGEATQTPKQW